jgi:hypothetical protein
MVIFYMQLSTNKIRSISPPSINGLWTWTEDWAESLGRDNATSRVKNAKLKSTSWAQFMKIRSISPPSINGLWNVNEEDWREFGSEACWRLSPVSYDQRETAVKKFMRAHKKTPIWDLCQIAKINREFYFCLCDLILLDLFKSSPPSNLLRCSFSNFQAT